MGQTRKHNREESYKPSYFGFNKELVRAKKFFWTPDPQTKYHPLLQCIYMNCHGHLRFLEQYYQKDVDRLFPEQGLTKHQIFHEEEVNFIAKYFDIQIDIYHEKPIQGGRKIEFKYRTPDEKEEHIALLQSYKEQHYYAIIWPDSKGKISHLADKRYCYCHGNWINLQGKWSDHIKNCLKCPCGAQYNRGSDHALTCQKLHYDGKKRQTREEMKRYEKEKDDFSVSNCFFADFETLILRRKYVVYAGAFIDADLEQENVSMFIGEDSLDKMMWDLIDTCKDGEYVVWYHNGSRFDNFFILPWILRHRIPIVEKSTIIANNTILSIGIETENGSILFKDLAKFLQCSLEEACRAFKLPQDKSKGDLDHDAIRNWDDVARMKVDIEKYLSLDVIALKHVYLKYAKTIYDMYKLYVGKFMTSTQIALAAFTSELSKKIKLYKTSVQDEPMMRAMYKGGRVICGRPKWRSNMYDKIIQEMRPVERWNDKKTFMIIEGHSISRELYNGIEDYLVYADVNSLYPKAQVERKYPCGRHKIINYDIVNEAHEKILRAINSLDKKQKQVILLSGFLVDVECPKDLGIAFLMTKNQKGQVEQTLYDKKLEWFTGPELWESIKLGYKIKRIYKQINWPNGANIFDDFVKKTYKIKKDNDKDTPLYTCAKSLLNALTGKFGQHLIWEQVVFRYPEEAFEMVVKIVTEIYDEQGDLLGWYGITEKEHEFSSFPIHLSSFILGWARVFMSRVLRKMKIERDDFYCPIYGDTDSLILHVDAFSRLPPEMVGEKELGQLKLEIKGKIITCYVLAPKTYCVIYVDEKSLEIKAIIKSKGIPHSSRPFDAFEIYSCSPEEREHALREVNFLTNRRMIPGQSTKVFSETPMPLKTAAYIFRDKESNIMYVSKKIPPLFVPYILERVWTVEAVFGGMIRKFEPGEINDIFVTRDSKSRYYNKTDWWARGLRQMSEKDVNVPFPTAYPMGHKKLKKEDDK